MNVTKWASNIGNPNGAPDQGEARRLLDTMAEVGFSIISFNQQGNVHYCSPSLEILLDGRPSDQDAFISAIATTEPIRQQIRRLVEGRDISLPDAVDVYIKGTPVSLTGVTVPGTPPLRMIAIRDTTGEAAVKDKMERLERLATVGQIAAGAVHEFNNNLTSILGWAQIAEQNTDPKSPAASAVAIIADNARKARRIFSKLLNMSRTKTEDEAFVPASPLKVLDDAMGILFFEMKSRNIQLTRSYQEVGNCRIDEDRLNQVFINIIKNAMEAMEKDGELSVSTAKDNDTVRIAFRDTGPGMPPERAGRVFESFFTTKKKDESALNGGTGLGLSISLDIIRQHGGDIEITSELGRGSCFTVVLPALDPTDQTERPSYTARPTIPPGAVVLVVDDEPDIGEMIRMSLELKGVSVLSVQSGDDAIAQLKKMHFDAAFVDYSMPGLSGHNLGREILAVDPELPVVFMSGLTVELDSVIGDFIKKPFDLDDIQAKLYEVLKRKKESRYRS